MSEERKAVDSQEYEARLNGDRAALKIIDSQRDRIRYLEAQVAELRDKTIEECAFAIGELDGGGPERDTALDEAIVAVRSLKKASP